MTSKQNRVSPLDKMIIVISTALGRTSQPYLEKKDINEKKRLLNTTAQEIKQISMAINSSSGVVDHSIKTEIDSPTLNKRTQERLQYETLKEQLNIESVTSHTAEELENEPPVSDEPISEDWITRFFKIVKEVSDEEMQTLWGKILAGEIKQPNTYSLRTLELLRNMSKNDAEVFSKFARLAIQIGNAIFIINPDDTEFLHSHYNISYQDRLLMREIGLISANDLNYSLGPTTQPVQIAFTIGENIIIVDRVANMPTQGIPVIAFTKPGMELLRMIQQPTDLKYLNKFAELFKEDNIRISYSRINQRFEDGRIHYVTPTIPLPVLI